MTAVNSVIDGTVQFTVVPTQKAKRVLPEKLTLEGKKFNRPDSAVQVHVFGDPVNRQYSAGQTMRNSESAYALRFAGQEVTECDGVTRVVTTLVREDGQRACHHVLHRAGARHLEVYTTYTNGSPRAVTLEMLSSFSLGSVSPFTVDNDPESLTFYRMRSQWSHEAKLETLTTADLILEPSWMNYGARGERFGSIGSMPAKPFMPFIGYTDRKHRVTVAASLASASSWQMEFYLSQNSVNLSGGIADFEFGHWRKTLAIGESLETPHAYVTAVVGDIDEAAQNLTEAQLVDVPDCEKELPVLYNDWCCDWGACKQENLLPLIDAAAEMGAKYFVIDAGWFNSAFDANGVHVEPKAEFYPNGLEEIVERIEENGMRAGVWFEPESRDGGGQDLDGLPLLRRDGQPIRNLERIFLDMTDERVRASLRTAVIGNLQKYRLGYVKFDYNENIGVGCDGAESLGEGLRKQIAASEAFYKEVQAACPELVIELCSSGGMRCVPNIVRLGSMMSFSDIHETEDEPVVACDIQRVLHPSKSQIWATLHPEDSDDRLLYTLACGFYGRLCLSGHIDTLSAGQKAFVKRAVALYRKCAPTIARGRSYFIGKTPLQRNLTGYKGSVRIADDGRTAVIVVHCFDDRHDRISIDVRGMQPLDTLLCDGAAVEVTETGIRLTGMRKQTAAVVYLHKSVV